MLKNLQKPAASLVDRTAPYGRETDEMLGLSFGRSSPRGLSLLDRRPDGTGSTRGLTLQVAFVFLDANVRFFLKAGFFAAIFDGSGDGSRLFSSS